jgi:hypothetical protein
MGLDMYLEARRFIWPSRSGKATPDTQINAGIKQLMPGIGDLRVKGVTVEAMYWRKANAIHRWFVNECQDGEDDCRHSEVSRDQLIQLRDLCQRVLDDPDRASELLPTQGGFFFGSTEYGEDYTEDLRNTVKGLTSIIDNAEFDKNWDFYYHSSW